MSLTVQKIRNGVIGFYSSAGSGIVVDNTTNDYVVKKLNEMVKEFLKENENLY
jgi:hypothetical protein